MQSYLRHGVQLLSKVDPPALMNANACRIHAAAADSEL